MIQSNKEIAIQYANDVLTEKIIACKFVKQSCKIFLDNLERDDLYFDESKLDKVVEFINCLYLSEQEVPTLFYLQPFQTFIIANIYGFYFKNNNKRKIRYVYVEIPRKNGKSMLINALALYHLIFDNDSQIVLSANSREQAKNVNFKQVKNYCRQLDPAQKSLVQYYSKIIYSSNELIVTSSDAKKQDGLNCSVGIVDELHSAKNGDMYNVIKSSQVARKEPLMLVITTAGDNTDSFCYQMRSYMVDILSGKKKDDSQFSIIYTLDDGDDYTDEKNWFKANPNLGISCDIDFYKSEIVKAANNPVEENGVKVKNFNIWLQSKGYSERYIDNSFIKSSFSAITIDDKMFDDSDCWVGADLGVTSDITAVSIMIEKDDKFYFFIEYYLPEFSNNSGINLKQFKEWAQKGYINITPNDNATNYEYITDRLVEVQNKHFINKVSYDRYNSYQWVVSATEKGLFMEQYNQSSLGMNEPMKELSRLLYSNKVRIQYNPVTEWMFNNCVIQERNNLIKPAKLDNKNTNKIDGVSTMITCLGGYLKQFRFGSGFSA